MHAHVHTLGSVAGDAQKLNGVAQVVRHGDVLGGDGANALLVHIVGGHARAKANRGENGRFAGGIKAVDIGGGVGLGVALGLRVGEHVGVIGTLCLHTGENVVGGAV